MTEWTLYTLDEWWDLTAWTWLPRVHKRDDGAMLEFMFFSIRGIYL